LVNSTTAILPCASKTRHDCHKILQHTMKCSTIRHKHVERGYVASIITTNVQNGVALHKHKPRNSVSSFVSCLIDSGLLYARYCCSCSFKLTKSSAMAEAPCDTLIEKSLQSMKDFDIHPRSSKLLLLNGCTYDRSCLWTVI